MTSLLTIPARSIKRSHRAGINALRRIGRRQVLGCIAAAVVLGGSGDGPLTALGAPRKPRAWFDAKGAFVFPLGDGPLPTSRDEFADSLTRGWKAHLRFPEAGEIVHTDGGRYPAIGSLRIKLAGGIIDSDRDNEEDKKKTPLRPSGKVEGRVAVRDFDLDAQPLVSDKARLNIHVTATDARFDLEHDDHGRPLVMLADARDATLEFQATRADIERILVQDLTEAGQRYGLSVTKAKLKLDAVNNRSIDVDLRLSTKIAFIPAGMHFQAHVDIDNEMYAKISHLKCDGDEALGPLIVNLIRPGLNKYEGKSRLVFSFPTGQLKLRNVKIQGGEELKVSAMFAR